MSIILVTAMILGMCACNKQPEPEEPVIEEPIIEEPEPEPEPEPVPELIIEDPRDSMTTADLVREAGSGFIVQAKPVVGQEGSIGMNYEYVVITESDINRALGIINESGRNNNINISPISLDLALAMLANGSSGETLNTLEEYIGKNLREFNTDYRRALIHYGLIDNLKIDEESMYKDYEKTDISEENQELIDDANVDETVNSSDINKEDSEDTQSEETNSNNEEAKTNEEAKSDEDTTEETSKETEEEVDTTEVSDLNTDDAGETEISIANSFWYDQAIGDIKEYFTNRLTEFYNAQINGLDFSDEEAANSINDWVKEKTNDKIEKIIEQPLNDDSAVILNAIYFNAVWKNPFVFDTASKNYMYFYHPDGSKILIRPMVDFNSDCRFFQSDKAKAFIKDYDNDKNGTHFAFIGILPNEDLVDTKGRVNLTSKDIVELMNTPGEATDIKVSMPRFKIEFSIELKQILSKLGLAKALNGEANYSKITDSKLTVDKVIQKSVIDFNEQGTEASAATAIIMDKSAPVSITTELEFNHTFLYMIVDKDNGKILFMGKVSKPEYSEDDIVTSANESSSESNSESSNENLEDATNTEEGNVDNRENEN